MAVIELETLLPASREEAFRASLNVDLHQQSMKIHRERATGGVRSGVMALGDEVVWEAWHFGVRWTMKVAITGYEAPVWFRDEMVRGPFKRMRHDHFFDEIEEGTRMRDRFEFEAPLGFLGRLAERWCLESYLRRLLERRNREIAAWLSKTEAEG